MKQSKIVLRAYPRLNEQRLHTLGEQEKVSLPFLVQGRTVAVIDHMSNASSIAETCREEERFHLTEYPQVAVTL